MKRDKAPAKNSPRRAKTRRRRKRLLADVVAAEARIDAGTFGLCEACGRAIALARLQATPTTRRCWRCQSGRRGR
jgi:RNA polymerase-binding transcription factor DksA